MYTKRQLNRPKSSIVRPSKIYTNWDFWLENKPSGNYAPAYWLVQNYQIGSWGHLSFEGAKAFILCEPILDFFQLYVSFSLLARASRSFAGGQAHNQHEIQLASAFINTMQNKVNLDLVIFRSAKM
jgi:hypothetical protein